MKKYDEGYTLPFVLVVFLILSLVATSILTISLRNLQSQKDAVRRMENRYAAQSEIEKVVAEVTNLPENSAFNEGLLHTICASAVVADDWQYDDEGKFITFTLNAANDTVKVSCKMILSGISDPQEVEQGNYQYLMIAPKLTYESYTITAIAADGGEAQ